MTFRNSMSTLPVMPKTLEEIMDDYSNEQLALLEQARIAKLDRDNALDKYARTIHRCVLKGISFGALGRTLGIPREAVWKSEERYLRRIGRK